jgi:hypothetical protein
MPAGCRASSASRHRRTGSARSDSRPRNQMPPSRSAQTRCCVVIQRHAAPALLPDELPCVRGQVSCPVPWLREGPKTSRRSARADVVGARAPALTDRAFRHENRGSAILKTIPAWWQPEQPAGVAPETLSKVHPISFAERRDRLFATRHRSYAERPRCKQGSGVRSSVHQATAIHAAPGCCPSENGSKRQLSSRRRINCQHHRGECRAHRQ